MPRKRRDEPQVGKPRWNASQLVAFNLARARRKAEMTQQEAAEAISRYMETEWTQATVATAEGSVAGARIRQFTPAELLAFCFVFEVPIGWFFMPPPGDEAEALEMPKHPRGIGWDWVFRRTTPTDSDIDAYLDHQGDWVQTSQQESERRPFHDRIGNVLRGGRNALSDDELQMYFLFGLFRRGLGGPRDLRRGTFWGEQRWFDDAAAVLNRVAEAFAAMGQYGPSPAHVMRRKDMEDARRISEQLERKRAEAGRPICGECFKAIERDPNDAEGWVHVGEDPRYVVYPHEVVVCD